MNIEAMKLALEALQGGYGDTKSWHKAIESAIKALRTAIQQAEAQQPATATACGIPGMAKTTCPYCELGFAFERPDAIAPPTEDGTEYDYASGYTAGYAAGWNEYRDGMAWLLAAKT